MSNNEFNLILVHPGQTELDEQGRLTGNLDLPLSQNGELQSRLLAEELADEPITLIVTAPDLAAQQTAQAISRDGAVKVKIEENLANLDVGLWHGKEVDELKENQPKLFRQWREQPRSVTPPEGETIENAEARVRKALKWINKKNRNGTVVIVASHPLAAIVQAETLKASLAQFWDADNACGTWSRLDQKSVAFS